MRSMDTAPAWAGILLTALAMWLTACTECLDESDPTCLAGEAEAESPPPPPPCGEPWFDCMSMISLDVHGGRAYPDEEEARPAEGVERIRVTVTCGEDEVVAEGELIPQEGGGSLIDLPDIALPVDAGPCTVAVCIIGPDGVCVAYCEEGVQEVEVRPGENPPVTFDLLCVDPFPGGINVRVGMRHVRPGRPVFEPSRNIAACGGFTEMQFTFEVPPPAGVGYSLEVAVADPLYADRVRIVPLESDRFRIIGLAHGEQSDNIAANGRVPLRATLEVGESIRTYDTQVYVRERAACACEADEARALEPEARGADGAALCAVGADGALTLVGEALEIGEWASCRASLERGLDISGLFSGAPGARLHLELCNDGPDEEWVTVLLYSRFQPFEDRPYERASLQLEVGPRTCEVHTIGQADFELDPSSSGQFMPGDIARIELIRAGAAGPAGLSARLEMACCEAGADGCCPADAVEICDGVDDDCDGDVDEGFAVGMACEDGEGICRRGGRIRCEDGEAVCSAQAGAPAAEACDGEDDDCDGVIDEDFALGEICVAGVGECARMGLQLCAADGAGTFCSGLPGNPADEVENGLDDDCDGEVDEDLAQPEPLPCGAEIGLPLVLGDLQFPRQAPAGSVARGSVSFAGDWALAEQVVMAMRFVARRAQVTTMDLIAEVDLDTCRIDFRINVPDDLRGDGQADLRALEWRRADGFPDWDLDSISNTLALPFEILGPLPPAP